MDRQFLKFWGNFLLQAAEGQKRFEELSRWMTAGFSGADDLTKMFQEAYGLKKGAGASAAQQEMWEKAAAQFQSAFSEYLNLFGAVSRSRHEALAEEKARLEKKAEEQEKKIEEQAETIRKLRLALAESQAAEGKLLDGFQQLMEVQNEQFRQVTDSLHQFFSAPSDKDHPE